MVLNKQQLLERILDALCKVTKRDLTIFYPTKEEEIIPYLKKEIIKTLKDV